jgi:predicted RNase H-like nuclease (RuvC/YqgF family)
MAHTREELERLLRPPVGEENALDKWRREGYEQELRFLDAREKEHEQERALTTGAYMQQWYAYFDNVIASERAVTAEQVHNVHDVLVEAMGETIAEVRHEIKTGIRCAIDTALADVKRDITGLQQTLGKQKAVVEKLLPEIALLKRQVKMLEDAHNKSIQNSLTHLHDRMAAMEGERRVGNESAIAKLQTRLEAAEDELKGAARIDRLPPWIQEESYGR